MKTVKHNVFKEHQAWLLQHARADRILMDAQGNCIQALYDSPLSKWEGLIGPDGCVYVPDMEYYNSLTNAFTIKETITDLQDAGFLPPSSEPFL